MKQRNVLLLMQVVATATLLSACGGGGSDAPARAPQPGPLQQVPGSASQSVAGMVAYLKALVALAPDDGEPVDAGGFAPPVAEDAEPDPVS